MSTRDITATSWRRIIQQYQSSGLPVTAFCRRAQEVVAGYAGRIVLHFLPPYCPDDNRIERCV